MSYRDRINEYFRNEWAGLALVVADLAAIAAAGVALGGI